MWSADRDASALRMKVGLAPPVVGKRVEPATKATSVADGYGRLHEADNGLEAGAGLFPSIGAVSPTFTILAMAERTADRLARGWGEFVQ
jgi:choline dehydrogenase-like flavoprotein